MNSDRTLYELYCSTTESRTGQCGQQVIPQNKSGHWSGNPIHWSTENTVLWNPHELHKMKKSLGPTVYL